MSSMMEGGVGVMRKVMVAIDGSESSSYALQWTLENLRNSIFNSDLLIFTVQPFTDYAYAYIHASSFGVSSPGFLQSIQESQKNTAHALLERAKEICRAYGINAQTLTEVGDPKELICETVDMLNIDLLVLGSQGALKRAFLGSVSNYCVNNAKCQVLVVRRPA